MNLKVSLSKGEGIEVVWVFSDEASGDAKLEALKESKVFKAKVGETLTDLFGETKKLYLGFGKKEEITFENIRTAFFKAGKQLSTLGEAHAYTEVQKIEGKCYGKTNKAVAEGLLQSEYRFDKFISEKKPESTLKDFTLTISDKLSDKLPIVTEKVEEVKNVMEGVFLARDLINEPAMYMTPTALADAARDQLTPLGVEVQILEQKDIEALGMKAYLAVSKGSEEPPKFIIMKWNGDPSSEEKLAIVGKGLTYDSGGYCIKTPGGMSTMHCDMGGGGATIGAMYAIAKNKVAKNVVAVIAACENMISGGAYKTGDIISSMAGKTIHIGSTDAEGRLTLADALYYVATKEKPNRIIDLATLTGAVVSALGSITTAVISNDDEFAREFIAAGEETGEMFWQLPTHEKYRKLIKGDTCDLLNVAKGGAGTITAGLFLENFVEDIPWVHLDIAGTAYFDKPDDYLPKGATGIPVKTLYNFVKCNGTCSHRGCKHDNCNHDKQ